MSNNGSDPRLDPTVERAIVILEQAASALKRNNKYNNGLSYPDFMLHGHKTALDRVAEPLWRTMNSHDVSQANDILGYVALGVSYFMDGAPKSRIVAQSFDEWRASLAGEAPPNITEIHKKEEK